MTVDNRKRRGLKQSLTMTHLNCCHFPIRAIFLQTFPQQPVTMPPFILVEDQGYLLLSKKYFQPCIYVFTMKMNGYVKKMRVIMLGLGQASRQR